MRKQTPETIIKNQIKSYLDVIGVFHFPIMQGMGSYKGIPDRLAIKEGVTYYIEIKSATGRQSEYQKEFQKKCEKAGGLYILARSVEDVKFLDKRTKLF